MAKKIKVKIGNLPNGYKFKNGKIVKVMATGGAPYSNSLGPIPRTFANLEAEKGETALTDLDNDGNFELYNIGGKRHQNGGTALSLPPQSFIFSDTAKMKLNKDQLTRFNINSKKKLSPAAVSKKFPLNKYYSILNGEFVDDIATTSAELMLDKNKMKLSELAFVSESKKKFEDGVPLAAYPYLMSKKIDPMQFVQKVNKLNEEQAMMQMIDQLPPEEQQNILALQNFTGGQGGPPPQGPPQGGMPPMGPPMAGGMPPMPQAPPQGGGMPPQGMMPPQQMMAKYGLEKYQNDGGLRKAQFQTPESLQPDLHLPSQRLQEVADMVPFNQDDFTSKYPKISYGNDINKGVNQGSLVELAEELVTAQNATPDPMYDGRYKADPQADYAQKGGMVAAGLYNAASPDSHNMIPAGLYNNKLSQFLYGGEDFANRYTDYQELQTFDNGGEKIYGMENYNKMLELYNSDDWDKVNEFGYETYLNARDKYPNLGALPEMTMEEYEKLFMLDQKFKYLMHEAGALDDITITLPNGQTVTGNDIKQHGAWDSPKNAGGFTDGDPNGMYRLVYEQLMQKYPDAGFEALPTDKDELMNLVMNKQATFSSLGGLQKHAELKSGEGDDSWTNLLSNVNLEAFGSDEGGSGLMGEDRWSDLDGKYGDTFNSQTLLLSNTPGENDGGRDVSTCYLDENGQVRPEQAKAKQDCETGGGRYDTDVCQCIEKGEITIPEHPEKAFWKQDIMKLDALSDLDLNKYYPSRQSFTGNYLDPAYKDPTREIAAISEQARIAGDMAAQMSGGQGLAAVLSKIQGSAGNQIADALNRIQSDNVDIYNQAQEFNAGVASNIDVLNQDAQKTYMDAVNLVDQNYDNAKNQLRMDLADAHANAWTNMANTYNMNTLQPNFNTDPRSGGIVTHLNNKYLNPNNNTDPLSNMDTRLNMMDECLARCYGDTEPDAEVKKACIDNCQKMVDNSMPTNDGGDRTVQNIPGYQGNNSGTPDWFNNNPDEIVGGCAGTQFGCCPDNTTPCEDADCSNCSQSAKYGSELRAELAKRRNGGWW